MNESEQVTAALMEMGFSKELIEQALSITQGSGGLESAMEWLLANSNAESEPKPSAAVKSSSDENKMPEESGETSEAKAEKADQTETGVAKSIVCDECGKKFKSPVEVEFHAAKSGHQSFSESTEEVKPLTEEEKEEQRKKLEDKIKQRRREKEEKDRQEIIEREKIRRKAGQEMSVSKQKIQEMEMKKLAEERRREKIEEKQARQRVKDQIERDKQARREKFNNVPTAQSSTTVPVPPVAAAAPSKEYDQCRLQIRLTNGQALSQNFSSKEQLSAVRLYVELNRTDGTQPFQLMTNFPKRVFSDEDMNQPLSQLGLVPSAVLILTKSLS